VLAQKGPLTAMQIRLTVVDPLGPPAEPGARAASRDVLVTAPAGTALAAVVAGLVSAVGGGEGPAVLYAGAERLDPQRRTLGEPPLTDGAVLTLSAPAEPGPEASDDDVSAELHVVAGPDAGGVHLLHGGQIRVGRSADADVPLDDPDVSRLHCAVTVAPDGRVTVADLGSTNGTTLDGVRVTDRPVRLAPGALLRLGESTLRLTPPGGVRPVPTTPDGEGHARVRGAGAPSVPGASSVPGAQAGAAAGTAVGRPEHGPAADGQATPGAYGAGRPGSHAGAPYGQGGGDAGGRGEPRRPARATAGDSTGADRSGGHGHGYGTGGSGRGGEAGHGGGGAHSGAGADGHGHGGSGGSSGSGDRAEPYGHGVDGRTGRGGERPGGVGADIPGPGDRADAGSGAGGHSREADRGRDDRYAQGDSGTGHPGGRGDDRHGGGSAVGDSGGRAGERGTGRSRKGTPVRGTDVPEEWGGEPAAGGRRRGGLAAWARRLAGGREDTAAGGAATAHAEGVAPTLPYRPQGPEKWPDPAALLLTALRPGPRLWERGPLHPEAFTVRLGTADVPAAPDGSGPLLAVPVTTGLREVGSLGLAGPRARLDGLARAVLAQLAALHSPDTLELVLISADRARPVEERTAEWSWLGWLPHLVPAHGQDCRLLLAYDREQATARTAELLRRLDDRLGDPAPDAAPRVPQQGGPRDEDDTVRRPSWARDGDGAPAEPYAGPRTVLVVDGDPGGADVREAVVRLVREGPRAGIHVICLAETAAASPASPVAETYEAACAGSPTFRECGAVALLSGDVATAVHVLRVAPRPEPNGSPAVGPDRSPGSGSAPDRTAPDARSAGDRDAWRADSRSAQDTGGRGAQDPGRRAAPGPYGTDGPAAPGAPGAGGLAAPGGDGRGVSGRHGFAGGADAYGAGVPADGRDAVRGGTTARAGRTGEGRATGIPQPRGEYGTPGTPGTSYAPQATHHDAQATHHDRTGRALRDAAVVAGRGPGEAGDGGRIRRGPVSEGTVAAVDAVSLAWAERFARALAPLRTDGPAGGSLPHPRVSAPLPRTARLLDELGLARATPASLMARWAAAADDTESLGGRAWAVLGAGPRGPVVVDLAADGPHLLVEGPSGSGRTELLRAVAASLAAAERPDRLGMVLIEGRDCGPRASGADDGLRLCTDLPHVTTHLVANDPVRMREFAQALSAELKRRAELLGRLDFAEWHTRRAVSERLVPQRTTASGTAARRPGAADGASAAVTGTGAGAGAADLESPPSATLRLRPPAARRAPEPGPPLARLVVVVDDLDALLSPALGSPGRPSAGSVVRALEAVGRDGARLGVHLVAATGVEGGRTPRSEPGWAAGLRVRLRTPAPGADEPAPGRGRLTYAPDAEDRDLRATEFQGGRVTGRIPRTATVRPTVAPVEWERMGDPPARRTVRELGNGPTDLALLASALERAARSVSATAVPSLL
jgi:hypothetical protein